jgi:hypothetical protein
MRIDSALAEVIQKTPIGAGRKQGQEKDCTGQLSPAVYLASACGEMAERIKAHAWRA